MAGVVLGFFRTGHTPSLMTPFNHPHLCMNKMNPSNLSAYLVVFKKLQGGFNITSTQTPENAETRCLLPHPFLNCLDSTLRTPVQFTRTASLVGATSQLIEKQHEFDGCLQTALESLVKADDCLGMPGWSLLRLRLALLLNLKSRGHMGTQPLSKTNWITPAGWRDTLAKLMTPKLL